MHGRRAFRLLPDQKNFLNEGWFCRTFDRGLSYAAMLGDAFQQRRRTAGGGINMAAGVSGRSAVIPRFPASPSGVGLMVQL